MLDVSFRPPTSKREGFHVCLLTPHMELLDSDAGSCPAKRTEGTQWVPEEYVNGGSSSSSVAIIKVIYKQLRPIRRLYSKSCIQKEAK